MTKWAGRGWSVKAARRHRIAETAADAEAGACLGIMPELDPEKVIAERQPQKARGLY